MTEGSTFTAGVVQMCAGRTVERNLRDASELIRKAHAAGARFVATPEMTNILDTDRERVAACVSEEKSDAAPRIFAELAQELGIHLLIGSLALRSEKGRLVNRSLLLSPQGRIVARYDKIHMFDVDLGERQKFQESRSYEAGGLAVTADLPWTRLGMTICYDLRFPQLYRFLAKAGACLISVPSAFTLTTGKAHWQMLIRARAIESGAFILAPAQGGRHECGRETYGHSLIVDPWGQVLAEGGEEPGIWLSRVETKLAPTSRARIPALDHDRPVDVERGIEAIARKVP